MKVGGVAESAGMGKAAGEQGTAAGEQGTGAGEQGTGAGEHGTGAGEQGTLGMVAEVLIGVDDDLHFLHLFLASALLVSLSMRERNIIKVKERS